MIKQTELNGIYVLKSSHPFELTLPALTFLSLPNIPHKSYIFSLSSIAKYSLVQFKSSIAHLIQSIHTPSPQARQEKWSFFFQYSSWFVHFSPLPYFLVPPVQDRQRRGQRSCVPSSMQVCCMVMKQNELLSLSNY